jgi:hypothetical protein
MGCCQSTRTDCDELQICSIPGTLKDQVCTQRSSESFNDLSLESPSPDFLVRNKPLCSSFVDKKRASFLETSFLHLPEELTAAPSSFARTQRDSEFNRSRETKEMACF